MQTTLRPGFWVGVCVIILFANLSNGDDLYLKNGLTFSGTALQVQGINSATYHRNKTIVGKTTNFWMVDEGVRRYFVHRRIVSDFVSDAVPDGMVTFQLQQKHSSRRIGPSIVGGFTDVQPFDGSGWRTVTIHVNGEDVSIVQGITELRPNRCKIDGLTHQWEYYVDTKTIPPNVIQSLVQQGSDRNNPQERKAAWQFYMQAKMYPQAAQELTSINADFPELADWSRKALVMVEQDVAKMAMAELKNRQAAGQHEFAYQIAKTVPRDRVDASDFRASQEIVADYEHAREQRDEVLVALDLLQAQLEGEYVEILRPMQSQLVEEMHFDNIHRLQPFLRVKDDNTLSAKEKLALAYSGWILGDDKAVLNLDEAINLWKARFLVREFFRNDDNPLIDDELVEELQALEYIGIERVSQMVQLLPPFLDRPISDQLEVQEQQFRVKDLEDPVSYSVMVPPEFSPYRAYPLLVVLRTAGRSPADAVKWWTGDQLHPGWAQRRGYLVIAPHFIDEAATRFDGSAQAHDIVIESIKDARKRFKIDSNRIYLVGHGMGADLAFELGMARPDVFAGVVPITGQCSRLCDFYKANSPYTSWYIVGGERDRNSLESIQSVVNSMMNAGQDVIYCEYKDRGYEPYYEETDQIFDWMEKIRRPPLSELKDWEAVTLRSTEDQFYWLRARGLKEDSFPDDIWENPTKKGFSAHISPGGTVYVKAPAYGASIWLSPELFDFNNRCQVRFGSRTPYRDFVKPSIKAMLEHYRENADRERLFWARLDI